MRAPRILLLVLCVSTLAVAATACGSGGGTTYSGAKPDTWAADVCGALTEWAQGLQADSKKISTGARDLKTVKANFVAFLESAVTRSDTMISKVQATGPPAIKDGKALQSDLEAGLNRAKATFERATPKAKALSSTDSQAFTTGVTALGKDVEKELNATGEQFNKLGDKYKDKALNKATSKDPACQKLSAKG